MIGDHDDVDVVAQGLEKPAEQRIRVDVVAVDHLPVGRDVLLGNAAERLGVGVLPEEVLDEIDAAQVYGRQGRPVAGRKSGRHA